MPILLDIYFVSNLSHLTLFFEEPTHYRHQNISILTVRYRTIFFISIDDILLWCLLLIHRWLYLLFCAIIHLLFILIDPVILNRRICVIFILLRNAIVLLANYPFSINPFSVITLMLLN